MYRLVQRAVEEAWGGLCAIWETCEGVQRDQGYVSGAWRFRDSRVPVDALFANLESGATVEQFCEWFPGVDQQVRQVLDHLRKSVTPLLLPDER